MSPELFEAFKKEISEIAARLAADNQSLETEENREAAERLRVQILYQQKLLKTITDARNEIVFAADKIDGMLARYDKWRVLCVDARVAKNAMDALEPKLKAAREACIPVQNEVTLAERHLVQHRQRKLPEYPTQPELRQKEREEQRLLDVYQAAVQQFRDLVQARDTLQREWIAAAGRFDAAANAERWNRLPPADPAPLKGVGTLSAVG